MKRGLSEMISYVLLVVLALGMAAAVFAFLSFYAPKNTPQCPDDSGLIIQEASCSQGVLSITLKNKGLFNLDGAYIKIGNQSRIVKKTLNQDNVYFTELQNQQGLRPGETIDRVFPYSEQGPREIEIIPVMFVDNQTSLCNSALVKQSIVCGAPVATLIIVTPPSQGGGYPGGQTINFDGSQSHDDYGGPLTYSWDFGDGQVFSGPLANHAYQNHGTYTVTLTVSNSADLSDSDSASVTISSDGGP